MASKSARQRIKRKIEFMRSELTCKPLDSYNEILMFLAKPPPWRTLVKELRPHSKEAVSNMDNLRSFQSTASPDNIVDYCHFESDGHDPVRYDATEQNKPKTLVCHDMANGYHDDSRIDGTVNYDSYTFYNWAGIDIFCYFSHHLITIPPLGWINVGHDHGVKVIGTIITEWAEGSEFWDMILESEAKYQEFANAVVSIAKILNFDGWLLNIENKVSKPDMLLQFVRYLHKLLHSELVDPVLIWYDSVTINGNLNWQNKLNDKNKPFFDACDGFFINYSWTVADIKSSVMAAGTRITDLYVGIDVWGRNFYCGGQFNTYEALKVAYNEGCSLAIFAPAWTHEAMTTDPSELNYVIKSQRLSQFRVFQLRDRALWASMWPYLHTRLPCHLPFQTSFCRGSGKKRWLYGEVISPGPWYNMRLQQYQPNTALSQHGYKLTPYDDTKKKAERKVSISKKENEIKDAEVTETDVKELEAIQTEVKEVEEEIDDANNRLKLVDSIQKITSESETKPVNKHAHRDIRSKSPSLSLDPITIKPILKKSLLTRLLDFFKCTSKPEIPNQDRVQEEPKERGYYEAEKIVSHTMVGTSAMAGASSSRKSSLATAKSIPTKEEQSLDGSVYSSRSASPDKANSVSASSPERDTSPERAVTPDKPKPVVVIDVVEKTDSSITEASASSEQVPKSLSFQGRGMSMITTSIYLNLRQPDVKTRWVLTYMDKERECLELYMDDGFNGGACLRVNPSDAVYPWHRMTRLFHCDFKCDNMLIVCVVTKAHIQYQDQYLNIRLKMKNAKDEDLQVVLLGRNLELPTNLHENSVGIAYSYPLFSEEQKEFQQLREYLLINESGFYVPIDNFYGWEIRYYKVHVPGSRVFQINCRTELPQGGILLGHLGICHRPA